MHEIILQDLEAIAKNLMPEAKKLEGKTLLISGGSGFLGNYIVGTIALLNKTVFSKPCKVISLDNFITGSRQNFLEGMDDPNITFREGDVTKPLDIQEPIDFIIHAAGLASPVYYQRYPLETIETTITGAKNLLELARKQNNLQSFLFFSSSEIYGDPDPKYIPTPEDYRGNVSSIGPRACYDESKRLTETICTVYHNLYKTPIKIVRPFNVYGPGMKVNDYRVVPNFIAKGLRNEDLPVHGKGSQTRTFCYISDAITGFLKVFLSEHSEAIYNVGNDQEEINMFELATKVSDLLPSRVPIKLISYPDTYPADEPRRRCPDLTKVKTLGYAPQVDLKTGLVRTIRWFQTSNVMTVPVSANDQVGTTTA
jgi:UDP-glucuronate decarboxylase